MITIPLQTIPAQAFNVSLDGQPCRVSLYQKGANFYMDLAVNNVIAVQSRMVLNGVWIVRYAYLGLSGDLFMFDTMGSDDIPTYEGLGTRYKLYYAAANEISAGAALWP